jgi:uncharacterized protein DUF2786
MPLSAEELAAKRQDILRKVRGLIAKADDVGARGNQDEADLFREKADELMEKFAIEMWMVEAANENSAARKPIGRLTSIDWLYGHPFADDVWTLFTATARFTRCIVASWKWEKGQIGVVGLEQDLDYFDLVFTHLLTEMGRRLVPSVDPNRDAEWNAWSLRSKHMGWPEIAYTLSKADMLPWPEMGMRSFEGWKYEMIAQYDLATAQAWRRKARKLYRDYCRKNDVEPEPSKQPATAARSYAKGWAQEIRFRMAARDAVSMQQREGTGMEVALRDIRAVVREAVEDIFPRPKPVPVPVDPDQSTTQRTRAVTYREPPFDPEAYSRGKRDASTVELSGSPHRRVENNPKELTE